MPQESPPVRSRSIIVGTHLTGVCSKAPLPSGLGTQLGTNWTGAPGDASQGAVRSESHPQPTPPVLLLGLTPKKPSSVEAASSRWEPQLADRPGSKVWSEITYSEARAVMFGT